MRKCLSKKYSDVKNQWIIRFKLGTYKGIYKKKKKYLKIAYRNNSLSSLYLISWNHGILYFRSSHNATEGQKQESI